MTSSPGRPVERFELGLGTGTYENDRVCRESVRRAVDAGYRHVDTARAYDNEAAVRAGIEASAVPADDVFVATKVHSQHLAHDDLVASVEDSQTALGAQSLDLVYVHWPAHTYDPPETMGALEQLHSDGVVERIGLSNFTVDLLREARSLIDAPIFAVQAEFHPYCQQPELLEYLEAHDVWLVAACPLMQGRVFEVPTLSAIASRHDTNEALVALAWATSKRQVAVIPKATGSHVEQNLGALDVELTPDERRRIDALDRMDRTVDYEFAPWND